MGDRDTERLIDAWLDGELPADEAARIETGLRCDPELRQRFGPMVGLLRSPEPIDVPADLRDRIVAAVHEQAEQGRIIRVETQTWKRMSRRIGWIGAVAASIALFLSGWYGAQWWMKPGQPAVVVQQGPAITDPWVAAACVQSLASRGPLYPTPFVVQGAMIEMLADGQMSSQGNLAGQESASPGRVAPQGEARPSSPVPLLPIIQRL